MSNKTLYLIDLAGQGDHYLALVPKHIIDWIDSPVPKMVDNRAEDINAPDEIKQAFEGRVLITSGTPHNDRALAVLHIEGLKVFYSTTEMFKWSKKHPDVTIEDGFAGYIY
jgi:hypothetical protein